MIAIKILAIIYCISYLVKEDMVANIVQSVSDMLYIFLSWKYVFILL